ncbi:MAG: hypothetical protein Q7K40_02575 [bacterium]|nr:hypothetical protein [bacterium]
MLNILSTEEKKKIIALYRFRLAVVVMFALGSLVLASLVLLAPSYLLAISKYNNSQEQLSIYEKRYSRGEQEKEISAQIREINSKILLLSGGDTSTRMAPSAVVSKILELRKNNVKIYGFTYDSSTNVERVVLTGTAIDRDALADFIETLKKDQTFTGVTLPISSYVKSKDIDFSIVLERKETTVKK